MGLTAGISVPLGVGAAIYLEEYSPRNWITRLLQTNIANLAGVPSIVYGILGLAIFVRFFGFGRSVLAGAATLALLILPVVIIAAQEALKAVPNSLREASYGVGATRWQTIRHQVLPVALAGDSDGDDPVAVEGHRRDRAAHHDRGPDVHRVFAHQSDGPVHRAPDSDLQLDGEAAGGVPRTGGRRDRRASVRAARHERGCDHTPQQVPETVLEDGHNKCVNPIGNGRHRAGNRNLSVFYGASQAVKEISLTIPRNRVVAFIGPSGCGKSTFSALLSTA